MFWQQHVQRMRCFISAMLVLVAVMMGQWLSPGHNVKPFWL